MLKAKNSETDGLVRDLWNHIAFLIGQQWRLRGEIRRFIKKHPEYSLSSTRMDWDRSKFGTRKLEIEWLRDIVTEHEGKT